SPPMKFVSLVLALVLAATLGLAQATAASTTSDRPSDKEMLLGLVYGDGPVANELGITQQRPSEISEADYRKALDTSVDELLTDSQYASPVARALNSIRSDDPRVIEDGLDQLGEVVIEQVETNVNKDPELKAEVEKAKSEGEVDTQACGVAVVCVAYAAAAVHNTVAVTGLAAVVVGAALWAGTWKWTGKANAIEPQGDSTKREVLVSEIADLS
ncbi:MAG: hypothetical protein L0J13_12990, partial [Brevibacterium sp.]|nr:hypothetical protein [Brevibacterium sp.]